MTTKKWNVLWKRLEVIFLIAIMLIVSSVPSVVEAATTGIQNVEDIDFSDFSNWRSGVYYYANGKYTEDSHRICLNNYVTFTSDTFKAHITNSQFRILVRELNSSKSFLRSVTLVNGQEYEPGTSAVYLAISVYKFVNGEADMSYSVFEEMFENGFVAEICAVNDTTTDSSDDITTDSTTDTEDSGTQTEREDVEDIDFTDFANWRSGHYHQYTGKYAGYSSRVCLKDYVTFRNEEYEISINKSGYHMLIRELDENLKFIQSYDLLDGKTYSPSEDAVYLAISIYTWPETNITYTTFKNLFANGFEAKLVAVEEEEDVVIDEVIENVQSSITINGSSASASQSTEVYDILAEMIKNGDSSIKDISTYNVTYTQFYNTICPQLREDLNIEFSAYRNLTIDADISGLYVVSCWLNGVDSDAATRVPLVQKNVEAFLDKVDSDMSNVEKTLLAHEYIVSNTDYQFDSAGICYCAGGPLGIGTGVCSGYAKAMILLLNEMGIEASYASSSSMNHGWVYVEIDGQWYHIDPTWDDTRKGTNSRYMHRFLLRNDEEFSTTLTGNLHYDWTAFTEKSTSTKYTDWYVHDVAGTMYYYDGMWYYWDIDTNCILSSNISGSITKIIVDGSDLGTIKLEGISGDELSYSIGTKQYIVYI